MYAGGGLSIEAMASPRQCLCSRNNCGMNQGLAQGRDLPAAHVGLTARRDAPAGGESRTARALIDQQSANAISVAAQ